MASKNSHASWLCTWPFSSGKTPNAGRSTGITCYRDHTHAHEAPCPQELLGRAHSKEVLRCCPRALGGQQKCAEPWVKQGHEEALLSCWLAVGLQALTRWCPRACSLELPHLQNCLDTTEVGPRDTVMLWWPWGAFAFLPKIASKPLECPHLGYHSHLFRTSSGEDRRRNVVQTKWLLWSMSGHPIQLSGHRSLPVASAVCRRRVDASQIQGWAATRSLLLSPPGGLGDVEDGGNQGRLSCQTDLAFFTEI